MARDHGVATVEVHLELRVHSGEAAGVADDPVVGGRSGASEKARRYLERRRGTPVAPSGKAYARRRRWDQ